jgi:Mycothiol maleylpyruvate isomerase N-terminal domain
VIGSPPSSLPDLRRAPLANLRTIDLRGPDRDFWADEAAIRDRFVATWAGLADEAWLLPGAAPSDAGGPDWSLAEHVGHVADWQELAIDYIGVALETGRWPSDDDYDGGDFDTYNERRREPWASMAPSAIRERLDAGRERLLESARRLSIETIRSDEGWGWVYMVLHGHRLDHLAVIEPWAEVLRGRQADGDPFVADPRPHDFETFLAADRATLGELRGLLQRVPPAAWTSTELTPGWTLRDHVAHLADWSEEGVRAVDAYRRTGSWPADPEEGIDAWNERHVAASASATDAAVLARLDREYERMRAAAGTLGLEELRSPDGWSWVYDCLYGHVRKHLALIGPWCATVDWPDPGPA